MTQPWKQSSPHNTSQSQLTLLKDACNALLVGILILDENETICYVNQQAAHVIGSSVEQLLELQCKLHISSRSESNASANGIESAELEFDCEEETILVSVSCSSFVHTDSNAEAIYKACLLQKNKEVQMLRNEHKRLLQLATLNEMLPTILHELRNPLAAIESVVQLLIEENNGTIAMDLHAILTEVRRMNLTLHGIGSVSKDIHSKKFSAIDYHIEDVIRIMNRSASKKHVSVISQVSLMPLLPLNPSVISAVAFNLINNAIDACSSGGQIAVKADLKDKNTFILRVTDNGEGMTPEAQKHCQELFYSTKARGTGVGLALCSRTILAGGGTLDIKSEKGKGTRISISIPLKQYTAPSNKPA